MTTATKSQGQIDRESMGAQQREATFMDVEMENRAAFARHSAGWTYSDYVGEFGGWSRPVGVRGDGDGVKIGGAGPVVDGNRQLSAPWRSKSFATAEAMGIKQSGISGPRDNGKGDRWFQDGAAKGGSKSMARKMASAKMAKIPFPLASHIARVYKPTPI